MDPVTIMAVWWLTDKVLSLKPVQAVVSGVTKSVVAAAEAGKMAAEQARQTAAEEAEK